MAGRSLSNWTIPALPPRLLSSLPKRLDIADAGTALTSVTHPSFHALPSTAHSLEPSQPPAEYGKLKHIGTPVIASAATMICHKLFPWLRSGPSSNLRNQVCSNHTLAQISTHLGLPKQLRAHTSQIASLRDNPSVQAALFQAYIGALAVTDQNSIRLNSDIASHLEKIFEPIVQWAFKAMKDYHEGTVGIKRSASEAGQNDPPSHEEIDRVAIGAKGTLDAYFDTASRGTCKFETSETQPFSAVCEVVLTSGMRYTTTATRTKKKMAVAAAAWEMCGELLLPRLEVGR